MRPPRIELGPRVPEIPKTAGAGQEKIAPANWNSVLVRLPSRFTIGDLAKGADAKEKTPVYIRQTAVRWAKQGKTKRVGRANYEKFQQAKSHAAARPRRK